MNEGVLQSSSVQQMVGVGAAAGNNWFTTNGSLQHHSFLAAPPPPLASPLSWPSSHDLPQSWSQLVLGYGGEEDMAGVSHMQPKNYMENNSSIISGSGAAHSYGDGNFEFTAAKSTNSLSSPNSCLTTNKSSKNLVKSKNSGCGAKKSKMNNPTTSIQSQSQSQSGIKVRKEKLGDRITALHQIVSPFGKTDTASVLMEAIGYIRFLQRQIEALSLPYLGSASGNVKQQQYSVKRERSCLFPEDPGQLLNENRRKRNAISHEECEEEEKKDLKSRGLCLVPLSCTVDFGSENGADYWAASFAGNF